MPCGGILCGGGGPVAPGMTGGGCEGPGRELGGGCCGGIVMLAMLVEGDIPVGVIPGGADEAVLLGRFGGIIGGAPCCCGT